MVNGIPLASLWNWSDLNQRSPPCIAVWRLYQHSPQFHISPGVACSRHSVFPQPSPWPSGSAAQFRTRTHTCRTWQRTAHLHLCPLGLPARGFVFGLGRGRTSIARKVGRSTNFNLSYKAISAASPPDWRRTIQQVNIQYTPPSEHRHSNPLGKPYWPIGGVSPLLSHLGVLSLGEAKIGCSQEESVCQKIIFSPSPFYQLGYGPSEGTRTPSLMAPNHALYQLRYTWI